MSHLMHHERIPNIKASKAYQKSIIARRPANSGMFPPSEIRKKRYNAVISTKKLSRFACKVNFSQPKFWH